MSTAHGDRAFVPGWGRVGMMLAGAGIFGATLLAYWPALTGEFLWNDADYVTAPALRSFGGLSRIWTTPGATEQYYPLLHSFFWLQHWLWDGHPLGYHLVTLLLHVAAAGLFGLLLRRLAVPGAWLAAAIFALHPVHVESVAWITEQKNTLSLVFYLLAALVYSRFDETRRLGPYAIGFGLFVLSLLCKTVTASLPAALLVVFWWKRGRLEWRRDVRPLMPWLAVGLVAGLFSSWVEQHYLGARGEEFDLSLAARGLVAGRAICFYGGHLLWPAGLNFIYPRWTPDGASGWQWGFPLAVIAVAVALWSLRHRNRAPLAAFLFFIGSLFPVLGFVNLYGAVYSFVWDHWQYLPDLGPIALMAAGLAQGWTALTAERTRWLGPALAVVLLAGLGLLTWRQVAMYRDPPTFYRTILAGDPDCWFAHVNLGDLLYAAGRPADAVLHYERALQVKPVYPEAQNNLGLALARLGRNAEAIGHYQEAVRLQPRYAAAHNNLAIALLAVGRPVDAIVHYRTALALNPGYADAAYNLGLALQAQGRPAEAVVAFEQARRLRPDSPETLNDLGDALHALGRDAEAIPLYEKALQLKPDSTAVHINLGIALVQSGQAEAGLTHLEKAVELSPDLAVAHRNLAVALRLLGREREADAHEAIANRLEAAPVGPVVPLHPAT